MYDFHNHLLALGINVRRGLVKDVDGRIVKQGPRERKALLLSAREVAAVRCKLHLEAALRFDKGEEIHLPERLFHLKLGRLRLCEQEVFPHARAEEPAVMPYHGQVIHEALGRNAAQLFPVQPQRAAVTSVPPHQYAGNRGFSRAGNTYQGHKGLRGKLERDAL